jgi:hypothetical protein
MIRPLTCVCLVLAAGSGLYLYQVKQRAFALDASLRTTFHDIDVARERTRMLRADWALVNDPERLQALASQYLTLQPMQPKQLLTMDQLAAALPPPVPFGGPPAPKPAVPGTAPGAAKPASVIDPTNGVPMAEAVPRVLPHTSPVAPEVALLRPAAPQPAAPQPAPPLAAAQSSTAPQPPMPVPGALPPIASAPLPPLPSAAASSPPLPALEPGAPEPAAPQPAAVPVPRPPELAAAAAPPVAATPVAPAKPSRHRVHHSAPDAQQPWLATAAGSQPASRKHADHHVAPPAPREFYAANVPPRAPDPMPRITPPAATVMYSPVGSSLGMASSAALAPPRPLYSTSQ